MTKHISKNMKRRAVCGAKLLKGDWLVIAAMHSDCDDCRSELLIGPTKQRFCEVKTLEKWTPAPLPGADELLKYVKQRRNGK